MEGEFDAWMNMCDKCITQISNIIMGYENSPFRTFQYERLVEQQPYDDAHHLASGAMTRANHVHRAPAGERSA